MRDTPKQPDANRDPITGAPGSHPVGTGMGAAAGGVAGAAAGTAIAGPAGTLVGAAVGAIAGGLAGKGVAEMVDPTVEDTYWRGQYASEPYYSKKRDWDFYAPAYRTGYEGRAKVPRPQLRRGGVRPAGRLRALRRERHEQLG